MNILSNIDTLILCGGMGTRFQEVDSQKPKGMAQIGDRPFLDIQIGYLKEQGVERVVLCTGHKADFIEEYYKKNDLGVTIEFSREEEPLGTGGAIKNAQGLVKSDTFFALNGDCYCDAKLQDYLEHHQSKQAIVSLMVARADDGKDFGSIELDASDRIVNFKEKSAEVTSPYFNVGFYCFNKEAFDLMPTQKKFSIEYDYFPTLIGKGFFGFKVENKFIDIGTPERFAKAQEFLEDK